MCHYYKSLSIAAKIMLSDKLSIIAQQVVVIFMTSMVTVASLKPVKNTVWFSPFVAYNSQTGSVTLIFMIELWSAC